MQDNIVHKVKKFHHQMIIHYHSKKTTNAQALTVLFLPSHSHKPHFKLCLSRWRQVVVQNKFPRWWCQVLRTPLKIGSRPIRFGTNSIEEASLLSSQG